MRELDRYLIQSIRRKHANGRANIVRSLRMELAVYVLQAIDIEGIRYITMIMMNGSILTDNQSYFEGVCN